MKTSSLSKHAATWPTLRQWLVTLACLCVAAGAAGVAESLQGTPVDCAARDLKLVNLIEERGAVQDVDSDQLADAFFRMMQARNACRQGRVAEALTIYDSIILALRFARVEK